MQNKKKIALFSCHSDPNYGSMLQAFALAMSIRKIGYEPEYIRYSTNPDPYTFRTIIRRFFLLPKKIIHIAINNEKEKGEFSFFTDVRFRDIISLCANFHKELIPCSKELYYYDTIRYKMDLTQYCNYIVGSDQLWSPLLYNPRKPYFLDFALLPVKNSYATSLGTVDIDDSYKQLLKEKLSDFQNLSCREKVNADLLTKYFNKKIEHVLDPTLLLDAKEWELIEKKPSIQLPYILAYILGEKDEIALFAEKLSERMGIPVYYVLTRPYYFEKKNLLTKVGPAEFIGLIHHSEYVITDSFHGSLFSIIFQKDFYAFSKQNGSLYSKDNVRIMEFLTQLNLQERVQEGTIATILDSINYKDVYARLSVLRKSSWDYLIKAVTEY